MVILPPRLQHTVADSKRNLFVTRPSLLDQHWGPLIRPVKRSLSQFEKSTLSPNQLEGLALVMPAEAGTEVEELRLCGFEAHRIRCIEHDPAKANELYEAYFDQLTVHTIAVEDFVARAQPGAYSYVHLDYCNWLDQTNTDTLAATGRLLAPHARLRITLSRNRKNARQTTHERLVYNLVTIPLVTQILVALGKTPDEVDDFLESIEAAHKDTTAIAFSVIMTSVVMGWPWREYADRNVGRGDAPPFNPSFWPTDVARFYYFDAGGADMETMWVDLIATDRLRRSAHPEGFLQNLLAMITPIQTSPAIYQPILGEEP